MENLINVKNENGQLLVSARDLHEYFESKERFSKWFNRMCEYGFEEDVDYVVCTKKYAANQHGGTKDVTDYACTISMAKEISMVQRNDKGKEARKYFIECEKQLKTVAIQSPQAFVDSLSLTEYAISKYLPNFLTWKNVDEVMPRLIERVTDSVDTGDIKLGVLSTTINVAKAVRDAYPNSAEKEIMTRYIEDAQAKYDRVLIASKAGITKANNDLRKQLEDKEKEIAKAETKRLKDFSDKALIKAYKESGIIGDLVDDHIKCVMDDELYKLFVDNLENTIRQIVKHSGNDYRAAHMMVYKRMGICTKGNFSSYTEYIFYNQWEMKCLQVAADILEKYL